MSTSISSMSIPAASIPAITISKDDISSITAFMNSQDRDGIYGFIDIETGKALIGTQNLLQGIIPDAKDENYKSLKADFDRRYLQIPQEGSKRPYQDRVNFIETVQNQTLQELLKVSIQGKGAFGRFKDVLRRAEYELELNRWYAFSEKCQYDRAVEWLTSKGFNIEG